MCPYCDVENLGSKKLLKCEKITILSFPSHLFSVCPHIKQDKKYISSVKLNNNSISELDIAQFLEFPKSTSFDFSFNDLKRVSGKSMGMDVKFKQIEKLSFGQTSPFKIDDGTLDGFFYLKSLDLQGTIRGHYTSLSWSFCHSHQRKMQDKANLYFDSAANSKMTRINEDSYCSGFSPTG